MREKETEGGGMEKMKLKKREGVADGRRERTVRQSLWETLVSLLKFRSAVTIKSVVDAWDELQSSVARQ